MSYHFSCRIDILTSLLLIVLLISSGVASEPTGYLNNQESPEHMTFYTEQLPPYNYAENDTVKGFSVDILEEISKKAGSPLSRNEIRVKPWNEAYNSALNGNQTVLFVTARIPERESLFKWVGPISIDRSVLFSNPDSYITIHNSTDLKKYRFGSIEGDASIQQLIDNGVDLTHIVSGTNATDLIMKLKNKQIDLWANPEFTGRYYSEQVTGDYYAFNISSSLDEVGLYYAFSVDVPNSTIESYQRALDELKSEKDDTGVSVYDRILQGFVPQQKTEYAGSESGDQMN